MLEQTVDKLFVLLNNAFWVIGVFAVLYNNEKNKNGKK